MSEQKTLTMKEIYLGLENQRNYYANLEEKYKALYEKAKTNRESIEFSMEGLSQFGDFNPIEEEEKIEDIKSEKEAEVVLKEEQKKPLVWLHKNAKIVKIGRDGTKLGTYSSQQKIADQLHVTHGTISYWMRTQSKEQQIAKRGFYLEYEY